MIKRNYLIMLHGKYMWINAKRVKRGVEMQGKDRPIWCPTHSKWLFKFRKLQYLCGHHPFLQMFECFPISLGPLQWLVFFQQFRQWCSNIGITHYEHLLIVWHPQEDPHTMDIPQLFPIFYHPNLVDFHSNVCSGNLIPKEHNLRLCKHTLIFSRTIDSSSAPWTLMPSH